MWKRISEPCPNPGFLLMEFSARAVSPCLMNTDTSRVNETNVQDKNDVTTTSVEQERLKTSF